MSGETSIEAIALDSAPATFALGETTLRVTLELRVDGRVVGTGSALVVPRLHGQGYQLAGSERDHWLSRDLSRAVDEALPTEYLRSCALDEIEAAALAEVES